MGTRSALLGEGTYLHHIMWGAMLLVIGLVAMGSLDIYSRLIVVSIIVISSTFYRVCFGVGEVWRSMVCLILIVRFVWMGMVETPLSYVRPLIIVVLSSLPLSLLGEERVKEWKISSLLFG